jgi:hypothetical protein
LTLPRANIVWSAGIEILAANTKVWITANAVNRSFGSNKVVLKLAGARVAREVLDAV